MTCDKKRVVFQPPGSIEFIFVDSEVKTSIPFISTMKVKRLLKEGCIGYLTNVIDTRVKPKVKSKDMLVVSQVFPKNLPKLPPNREIEFVIMSGTESVSKAPYRMAPIELKELKMQFQELLNKGFIRPSFSS